MLVAEEQLMEIDVLSKRNDIAGVVLMKHSTRCSISSMALNRLERSWNLPSEKAPVYLLDLLQFRSLSDKLAEMYGVRHESPQVLIIKDGKCIYNASHSNISAADIAAAMPDK